MCFFSSVAFQTSRKLHQHPNERLETHGSRLLVPLGTAGSDSSGASNVSRGSKAGVQLPQALGLMHRPATCIYICARAYSSMCVSVYKHFSWFLPFLILTFDSKRPQKQAGDFS